MPFDTCEELSSISECATFLIPWVICMIYRKKYNFIVGLGLSEVCGFQSGIRGDFIQL